MAEGAEATPSALFDAERARLAAGLGPVLDLACGRGRHALAAARLGRFVVALDRSRSRLAELARTARAAALPVQPLLADVEASSTLPLASASCGAVLVFRYLHRPLAPEIVRVLRPGGLLLYETFTQKQREISEHPKDPAFLLEPNELPGLFSALEILRAEEVLVQAPEREAVARLVAVKGRRD